MVVACWLFEEQEVPEVGEGVEVVLLGVGVVVLLSIFVGVLDIGFSIPACSEVSNSISVGGIGLLLSCRFFSVLITLVLAKINKEAEVAKTMAILIKKKSLWCNRKLW